MVILECITIVIQDVEAIAVANVNNKLFSSIVVKTYACWYMENISLSTMFLAFYSYLDAWWRALPRSFFADYIIKKKSVFSDLYLI
jgi:hypothetical protein